MTVEYLKIFLKYPRIDEDINKGVPEKEIELLEQAYNNSKPFPKVLKELIFLAGNYCFAVDYSIYDSPFEMQDQERLELLELHKLIIPRPFFFICLASYGLPLFIFLDEGDNPSLNQLEENPIPEKYFRRVNGTLPELIKLRISNHLKGFSMF
ncbi:hypothetical protein CLU96_2059 [Chryseobacterium sp. 52]|uniref:hypothetical protein n=1 Tax=Chryseobacterium sp. 52 TaxID=2035213 RepID=UPI000C1A0ED5|nr:hypothetical protein [Chryseobacterium sp. 52]PIF45059.1 hypothetical protein CLU96_2059 [Chryseobacterium sp. 52]